jgi:putative alpha-1,2-mannosidase
MRANLRVPLNAVVALAAASLILPADSAAGILTARAAAGPASAASLAVIRDPAALVNPFIGTGGSGHVFPGADVPFGMLQWSPDTADRPEGGGYSAHSDEITGFSLTHLSGVGCSAAGDVPVLPTTGDSIEPAAADAFSHAAQNAQAGYYAVRLANGTDVRLTATTRTGIAQFSFPAGQRGNLIFKLGDSQQGDLTETFGTDSSTEVQGSVTSASFCGRGAGRGRTYTLYFRMRFSRPASQNGTYSGGAYVSFPPGVPVIAKVGISYVSAAGAAANLSREDSGWSFAAIKVAAQRRWNALLDRIQVAGGTTAQRAVFYTALYHSLLSPSVFSDDSGQYTGADGKVHTVDAGQTAEYTNFSGWDIYRTQAPLEALLDPAAAGGAAQSLLDSYDQTGMLPRWPAYGSDAYTMVGDPADAVIAGYYAFGATGFDASAALAAMIRQGTHASDVRPGLHYLSNPGYLPSDGSYGCCNYQGPVATTLEYDTDDFAISAFAAALGDTSAVPEFRDRAQSWQNLLNPVSGLMQPRLASGKWAAGFSPVSQAGFVEGDSGQYTGMVPFNLAGLTAAEGGRAAMARYLNRELKHIAASVTGPTANLADEPSIELPFEYDYVGRPYETQRTVRAIQDQLWTDSAGGIPGNDDLGAMSAWYVWSALGLYPMTPGTATLALGSPLFSKTVIMLPSGQNLTIVGTAAATAAPYVQSATWDGTSWDRAYAPGSAITAGGTLDFRLGRTAHTSWAAAPADAPPSYPAISPVSTAGG